MTLKSTNQKRLTGLAGIFLALIGLHAHAQNQSGQETLSRPGNHDTVAIPYCLDPVEIGCLAIEVILPTGSTDIQTVTLTTKDGEPIWHQNEQTKAFRTTLKVDGCFVLNLYAPSGRGFGGVGKVVLTSIGKGYFVNTTNSKMWSNYSYTFCTNALLPKSKSYEDFINDVWMFESDVDPTLKAWYTGNWRLPVAGKYPEVASPGRVIRNPATGEPVSSGPLTVEEFFKVIGIADLYEPGTVHVDWKRMQAAVTNYLGFIGFQFQESDLHDLGYYRYEQKIIKGQSYPSHYVDVPVSHWKNGVKGFFDQDSQEVSEPTWVTDVVHFVDAGFTGKNGIHSVADFKNPDKHVFIIKDHFQNKYNGIVSGLKARGKTLQDYLGTTLTWNGLKPSVSPPPGNRPNEVTVTISGLLAGAHLRGAQGVVSLLVDRENPSDESRTYILQYVQDYARYETPYSP